MSTSVVFKEEVSEKEVTSIKESQTKKEPSKKAQTTTFAFRKPIAPVAKTPEVAENPAAPAKSTPTKNKISVPKEPPA